MLGYTDWADLRDGANSPGELHMALARLWQSLWANVTDELSRVRGNGDTGACFGLPILPAEALAAVPYANGFHPKQNQAGSVGAGLTRVGKGGAA